MKHSLYFSAQPAAARPHRPSMLNICAALFFTLAGLLGLEGSENGE